MDDTETQACQWKYCESECSWDTQCDNKYQFLNDGPKENYYKFCPGCGKPVTLEGDEQPAPVEPEELKALASATCSAAGVKIKHVFQIELVPKQKRELRKIWDDFAVDGGMILMQPILQWGPFEIQKCRAQGFVINKEGAAEINATVAKAQQ